MDRALPPSWQGALELHSWTRTAHLTQGHRILRLTHDFEILCLTPDFETLCLAGVWWASDAKVASGWHLAGVWQLRQTQCFEITRQAQYFKIRLWQSTWGKDG